MATVIRRRWQGGEEAELMTVRACSIRDACRTVSPPSGLCSNTPISLLLCERHRHCRRLPPPAATTACHLEDTFSFKNFAKKRSCLLLLLLQGSVIAATAALLPEADSVFFSKEDQEKTTTKQKKCRLKFFQQRKCVFIQLLTGFDKSCSGKLAASRKNAKLQTLQRLRKVLLDVHEFPLHVFWMLLLLLFSSSCSMDVETAGLKV